MAARLCRRRNHPEAILGGRAATAVVWNPVRQRFYAAIRYHGYYESADGATWTRLAHQPGLGLTTTACPTAPGTIGSAACPIFRGALAVQATTGDTFALTVDSSNRRSGSVAGCLCVVRCELYAMRAVTFGKQLPSSPMEVGEWQHGDSTGGLQSCVGCGAVGAERLDAGHTFVCGDGRSVSLLACCGMCVAQHDECSEWMRRARAGCACSACYRCTGDVDAAAYLSWQRWWTVAVDGWRQSAGGSLLCR